MPIIEINDLGNYGIIKDVEPYMLPPEAFSGGLNTRITDGGVERIGGHTQVFGTPTVAPHFALPVANSAQTFWLYTGLTKGYVFDGTNHINITRQSAGVDVNYTTSETREWNGTLLGGVPILNNGVDLPQFWSAALSTGVKLANLTNWDANNRAKLFRAFGPNLVAFNVTKTATNYPHLVLWSHPADPGSVPSSWNVTDATVDAGQSDLADVQAGVILEAMQLRGNMYIYKESSTWRMSFIGGSFVFDFASFLETSGILAERCVGLTPDGTRQVVVTQDDIIVHNGNSAESVLEKRYRKYLFNQIDTDNYRNSFVWVNPTYNEIGFAYPEQGQINPNHALVWNYKEGQMGALTEREVNFRNAVTGTIESAVTETWATVGGTWADITGPWSQLNRRRTVAIHTSATKFAEMDKGVTILGTSFEGKITRETLGLVGRKRNGDWIVDYTSHKVMRRVWLKMEGGPVEVRIGFQPNPTATTVWSAYLPFNPLTQRFVDVMMHGVAVAIEVRASVPWRLIGYSLEGEVSGGF